MSIKLSQGCVLAVTFMSASFSFAAVKEYHLTIDEGLLNLSGSSLKRITVNGKFPAPLLEFEEGDDAVIHVHNNLINQDSSIHWHGLLLPGIMDGVPGFNGFNGIKPQSNFVYKFKVRQSGTYWYHAHSKGQEQDGLYGALIIYPKDKKSQLIEHNIQQDHVVMLSDFHPETSDQIQKNLKTSAEYYQNQRETWADVWQQIKRDGLKSTWSDRKMWNQMRMLKTDLSDVTGYTFLINGKTPEQNWTATFKTNEKVKLRFINASAMSFFDVRIPNLKMTVVAADGQPVEPVAVDEFRMGTAETYDVVVEPKGSHYQIEAESIDRSGFAIGTLHNASDSQLNSIHRPVSRPRAILSMSDMGHATDSSDIDHSTMNHSISRDSTAHGLEQQHIAINHSHEAAQGIQHSDGQHVNGHQVNSQALSDQALNYQAMPHDHTASHTNNDTHIAVDTQTPLNASPDAVVEGWANASTPKGNKALQYSDLKSLSRQADTREATAELVLRLGGIMERYIWTINGKKFSDAEPLKVKYGERIRIKFINESMMAHPMHLHGMFMQLENGQSAVNMPNKHTIIVPPAATVSALLTANELGEWAIHCHLLFHMSAGMMNKLIVAQVDEQDDPSYSSKTVENTSEQGDQRAHH